MLDGEISLEELEEKLVSYETVKKVLQRYLQRLLSSDQNTLALFAEMLDAVKSLSSARAPMETPADLQRVVELREAALYRHGGVARVEGVPAPPLLEGGIHKIDDPQLYGMSLICTWLDCIVSNPEQSLDGLRRVFLQATDPWAAELNRVFHVDLGRLRPIEDPDAWLDALLSGNTAVILHLAKASNPLQVLGIEAAPSVGQTPLAVWRQLLQTRPVYDLTDRYLTARDRRNQVRIVAMQHEDEGASTAYLYRIGPEPVLPRPPLPRPTSLGTVQTSLQCTLTTPIRLEVIEKTAHLERTSPSVLTIHLPLGDLPRSLALLLNDPPDIVLRDITPLATPPTQRLLRVSSSKQDEASALLLRIEPLPQSEWPSVQGWTRVYRFHDLGEVGINSCPPGSFLEVSRRDMSESGEEEAEVYFHRWGNKRASLRIPAAGLRRAAQTGTLVLLNADKATALDILASLQGLIGPAAHEIEPVVSRLDCHVRWRPHLGPALFPED